MFILFGNKSQKSVQSRGKLVERYCAECRCVQKCEEYTEVSKDSFTLFFVPIFTTDDKNNKYKCTVCGGNLCFDIPDSYLGEIDGLSEIGLSEINFEEKQESKESPKASPSDKIVLKCKHCKKKIRIPRINKAILVTCPHCKTKFRVNQNPYNELDALIDLDNKLDSMLMGDKIKKNRLVSNYEKKFMTYSKIQIYQAIIDDINFEEKQESKESPKASPSDKIVLKCKHCKKKIRIPRINKAILVTCPHCKTKFRVNQNPYNELDALIDLDNKLDSMLMGDKIKKNRLVSNYEKKFMTYSKIQIYQAIIDDIIRDNR